MVEGVIPMFDIYCPRCAGRRLIFPSQIVRLHNGPAGIVIHYRCWCGTVDAWHAPAAATSTRTVANLDVAA
jgi:hypothetical protein